MKRMRQILREKKTAKRVGFSNILTFFNLSFHRSIKTWKPITFKLKIVVLKDFDRVG